MSYTNTKVEWEARSTQNTFGDMSYSESVFIKARKQPVQQIVKTAEGKEELSKHYFYVDPSIEKKALEIKNMDKLDGELIVDTYKMCDLNNKVRMVRFITV